MNEERLVTLESCTSSGHVEREQYVCAGSTQHEAEQSTLRAEMRHRPHTFFRVTQEAGR